MFFEWLFLIVAAILILFGLGFALRWLAYMLKGVEVSWGAVFFLLFGAGLSLGLGGFLFNEFLPKVLV